MGAQSGGGKHSSAQECGRFTSSRSFENSLGDCHRSQRHGGKNGGRRQFVSRSAIFNHSVAGYSKSSRSTTASELFLGRRHGGGKPNPRYSRVATAAEK